MKTSFALETNWYIYKYADRLAYIQNRAYAVEHIPHTTALQEGTDLILGMIMGDTVTPFDEANTYLGVGDSDTEAESTQTGLQATTNKLYKAMEASYPQLTGHTLVYMAVFDTDEANFDWNEFTIANGNSDLAVNLNRKVQPEGTKIIGQVWTLIMTITVL
jgi:hypothetical protein